MNSRHRLEDLLGSWREIQPVDMVRDLAGANRTREDGCSSAMTRGLRLRHSALDLISPKLEATSYW
jgi:hypothetical protein